MTGAIEFLRKAKAIQDIEGVDCKITFEIINYLDGMKNAPSEADLVSKVMAYEIKDDTDEINHCGDCAEWMNHYYCDREKWNSGTWRGPSCEGHICDKFKPKETKETTHE